MAKKEPSKTNALRELDAAGIPHECRFLDTDHALSGVEAAAALGADPSSVFKTLVTQGKSGDHYVFMVPVAEELDLKKAAIAVREKSIAMIPQRDLLPLTGYVHGGCSPIGMKKQFRTVIDETAQLFDAISFSGGRIGCQITMAPEGLDQMIGLTYADITVS